MEDLDSQSNKEGGLAAVHAEEDSGNNTCRLLVSNIMCNQSCQSLGM